MEVGTLLKIIADAVPVLEKHGVIDATGHMHEIPVAKWTEVASEVTIIIEQHGVDIDDRIEKIIKLLPMIIAIFGIK